MGSSLRAEWELGNGHFRHLGSWVQQWLLDSISECDPTTDCTTISKCLFKSECFMALAGKTTLTRWESEHCLQGLGAFFNHHYCLFLHSHRSLSCVGLFLSIDHCPKLSNWQVSQAKHQRYLHLLRTGARSRKSSLEITSCNTPQVSLFQADLILLHTKPF